MKWKKIICVSRKGHQTLTEPNSVRILGEHSFGRYFHVKVIWEYIVHLVFATLIDNIFCLESEFCPEVVYVEVP